MIINLKTATLEDVAKNYNDIIRKAIADADYYSELKELFRDCIGDDNLSVVTAYPDAFKAFENNGIVTWNVLILNVSSNITRLINAGYDKDDVLEAVANDIYMGSVLTDESPAFYQRLFNNYDTRTVRAEIKSRHPEIDDQYLLDIMNIIYDRCLSDFEINRQ